ncbi:hypothetical protein D3C76_1613710 [compost metagenome]
MNRVLLPASLMISRAALTRSLEYDCSNLGPARPLRVRASFHTRPWQSWNPVLAPRTPKIGNRWAASPANITRW